MPKEANSRHPSAGPDHGRPAPRRTAKTRRICPVQRVVQSDKTGFGTIKGFRTLRGSYEIERYPYHRDPG